MKIRELETSPLENHTELWGHILKVYCWLDDKKARKTRYTRKEVQYLKLHLNKSKRIMGYFMSMGFDEISTGMLFHVGITITDFVESSLKPFVKAKRSKKAKHSIEKLGLKEWVNDSFTPYSKLYFMTLAKRPDIKDHIENDTF